LIIKIQPTVDCKYNILIDYNVTNNNDSKAMGPMLRRAKTILNPSSFTALYDKGYHTGNARPQSAMAILCSAVNIPKAWSEIKKGSVTTRNYIESVRR